MAGQFGKSVLDEKSPFRVEALSEGHNRITFRCGVEALDRYFREQVTQDVRRRISNCFVAIDNVTDDLAGFYTLATSSILYQELPQHITKRLPRYQSIPAILLGRLAVDLRYRGRNIGAALLGDAVSRSARADAAAFTLLVDAKDESAAAFYRKHGFEELANRPLTLFLPIITALKLFT
jgi:ribosomal protein S18 acetylase RimI-like enzyme